MGIGYFATGCKFNMPDTTKDHQRETQPLKHT